MLNIKPKNLSIYLDSTISKNWKLVKKEDLNIKIDNQWEDNFEGVYRKFKGIYHQLQSKYKNLSDYVVNNIGILNDYLKKKINLIKNLLICYLKE